MVAGCYFQEDGPWLMKPGTVRNALALSGAAAVSVWAAYFFNASVVDSTVRDVLEAMWPVQGLLFSAVVALIYKLNSDTAGLKGMRAKQRRALDEVVTVKLHRLWALAALIVVPVVFVRISERFSSADVNEFFLSAGVAIAIFSALACGYLPPMWNELRRFVTSLVSDQEQEDRDKAALERLDGTKAK